MSDQPLKPAFSPTISEELAEQWGVDLNAMRERPRSDPEEVTRQYLAQARARDRLARFEADVGAEYRETDWDHPKIAPYRAVSARVLAWEYNKRGLLITGPSGRGKTRALCALYHRLAIVEHRDVRYYSATDWFALLGEQVRFGVDDARRFINAQARFPIFIMDDMGQQAKVSAGKDDWAQSWFFRLLDIRRAEGLPLIMTTNLSANEIASGAGEAKGIRSDPLLVRILDLCDVVTYETEAERIARKAQKK